MRLQSDFALLASEAHDREALYDGILATALALPDLDGGGLYLREVDGSYRLIRHRGLSADFIAATGHHAADTPQAQWVEQSVHQFACRRQCPACTHPELLQQPAVVAEGIQSLVVLPILRDGRPIACLNLASRQCDKLDPATVDSMQTLARQFGLALQHQLDAEETLHHRDNLEHLLDALEDYLFVVDMQGNVIHCNRAVAEGLGYGQQLIGQPVALVHPPEVREAAIRVVGEMLAGRCKHCPLPICRADGSRIMVDTRIVRGSWDGRPALIGISRDITEMEAQRQALSDREAVYSVIVNASPDGICLVDPETLAFIEVNANGAKGLGYSHEEFLGMTLPDIQANMDEADVRNTVDALLREGTAVFENIHRKKDGSLQHARVAATVVKIGERLLISSIWTDITANKRLENSLAIREGQLRATLEVNPSVAVQWYDEDARVIYWNPASTRLFGWSAEAAMGKTLDQLIYADHEATAFRELLEEIKSGSRSFSLYEAPVRHSDGSHRWALSSTFAIPADQGKRIFVCMDVDITDRKLAEAELMRHRDDLERLVAERTADLAAARDASEAANRAKSAFLANMSHELRTPMNGVLGMIEIARRHMVDTKGLESLAKARGAADHLLGLINDILDLSKIEAERMVLENVPLQIASIADHLTSMLGHKAAEKGLRLKTDIPAGLAGQPLMGDPLRLGQILFNLDGNAIKFTDQGSVVLRVRTVEPVAENAKEIRLRFEVVDTGIGITSEAQSRLFRSFEQADNSMARKYGGTGLGLAISKRLVELMGGEIGVESVLGAGSTFWFVVSLGKREQAAVTPKLTFPEGAVEAQLRTRYAGSRVLLAEDEPIAQEIACELLEDVGLAVELAEDGRQAVALAGLSRYDLILMDMQMPLMNGVDATRAIRADSLNRNTPILAMTANAFDADRQLCLDAGMNDHIAKPVASGRLYALLLDWLSRSAKDRPQPGV